MYMTYICTLYIHLHTYIYGMIDVLYICNIYLVNFIQMIKHFFLCRIKCKYMSLNIVM